MKTLSRVLFLASLLIFVSCNDDDDDNGPSTPAPSGQIEAELTVVNATGQDTDNEWSLPVVTANRSLGQISITASNGATGESLVITLPDNGVATYTNDTSNPVDGLALYTRSSGTTPWSSIEFSDPDDVQFFVQITAIDTAEKTLEGIFFITTFSPDTDTDIAFFNNGALTDVPYDEEIPTGGTGEGTMSADIDGASFTPGTVIATSSLGSISVTGTTSMGTTALSLSIPVDAAGGSTYDLGDFLSGATGQYVSGTSAYLTTSGDLEISAHDPSAKTISGTFSFEAQDFFGSGNASVTNGTFDVTYE